MGGGGRLLTFSVFRMGAYSRWALIRGWALIQINTLIRKSSQKQSSKCIDNSAENTDVDTAVLMVGILFRIVCLQDILKAFRI